MIPDAVGRGEAWGLPHKAIRYVSAPWGSDFGLFDNPVMRASVHLVADPE